MTASLHRELSVFIQYNFTRTKSCLIAAAVLWLGQLRYVQKEEIESAPSVPRIFRTTGEVRNVDMQRLREKIRRGELSDHEALYYDKIEKPRKSTLPESTAIQGNR